MEYLFHIRLDSQHKQMLHELSEWYETIPNDIIRFALWNYYVSGMHDGDTRKAQKALRKRKRVKTSTP